METKRKENPRQRAIRELREMGEEDLAKQMEAEDEGIVKLPEKMGFVKIGDGVWAKPGKDGKILTMEDNIVKKYVAISEANNDK